MENLENVTQSPIEIELKGKTYKLGVIGLIDYGDFVQYIKGQKIKLTNQIDDENIKLQLIEKIINENIDLQKEYSTLNGVTYMTWKALQKHQPEVTLQGMNDIVDMENFEQVSIIISNLGGKTKNQKRKVKEN